MLSRWVYDYIYKSKAQSHRWAAEAFSAGSTGFNILYLADHILTPLDHQKQWLTCFLIVCCLHFIVVSCYQFSLLSAYYNLGIEAEIVMIYHFWVGTELQVFSTVFMNLARNGCKLKLLVGGSFQPQGNSSPQWWFSVLIFLSFRAGLESSLRCVEYWLHPVWVLLGLHFVSGTWQDGICSSRTSWSLFTYDQLPNCIIYKPIYFLISYLTVKALMRMATCKSKCKRIQWL